MSYRLVRRESMDISDSIEGSTVAELIESLPSLVEAYVPAEFRDSATFEIGDEPVPYEDRTRHYIRFVWSSPETEDEYQERMRREELMAANRRATYENLKKEFG